MIREPMEGLAVQWAVQWGFLDLPWEALAGMAIVFSALLAGGYFVLRNIIHHENEPLRKSMSKLTSGFDTMRIDMERMVRDEVASRVEPLEDHVDHIDRELDRELEGYRRRREPLIPHRRRLND